MVGRHLKLLFLGLLTSTIDRTAVSGKFCSKRLVGGKWITRGDCGDEVLTQARVVEALQEMFFCGERKAPRNGMIDSPKSQYMPGDVIKFKCNDGHNLKGNGHDTCLPGGSWASNETPRCDQNGTALCEMRKGFYIYGICYTIALPDDGGIVHDEAEPECAKSGATLAEFEDRSDQEALKDFVIAAVSSNSLWVGMEYDHRDRTLHYISGSIMHSDRLTWAPGYPSTDYRFITIGERAGAGVDGLLLENVPMDMAQIGALCEKYYE